MFDTMDKLIVTTNRVKYCDFALLLCLLSLGYFHRFGVKIPPSKKCWGYFLIGQFMGTHQFARLFHTKFNAIFAEEKVTELVNFIRLGKAYKRISLGFGCQLLFGQMETFN